MPVPDLPLPRSSLPETRSRFGATAGAAVAACAPGLGAAAGAPSEAAATPPSVGLPRALHRSSHRRPVGRRPRGRAGRAAWNGC
ncbi:hypothetical protein GA0115253_1095611 [Streptomyces sp. Termitarium-T10T-6]|nr:hypothetical protein GA0115253_1095611 [Streptomyces sp. Termitarium-T10T-6]